VNATSDHENPMSYLSRADNQPFPSIALKCVSSKEIEDIIKSLKAKDSYGLHPLYPFPIYPTFTREGNHEEMQSLRAVGCIYHAPLDGRGADQALVENRMTISMLSSEYLINNVKYN
jgi:hypothetical protein